MHTPLSPIAAPAAADAASASSSASQLTLAHTLTPQDKKKLKDASVQLEATFTSFLMDELNKGLPGSEGDFGSQVYADMFKQSIATKVAESDSGKGLASQIYKASEKAAIRGGGSRHLPGQAEPMTVTNDKSAMAYKALSATTVATSAASFDTL